MKMLSRVLFLLKIDAATHLKLSTLNSDCRNVCMNTNFMFCTLQNYHDFKGMDRKDMTKSKLWTLVIRYAQPFAFWIKHIEDIRKLDQKMRNSIWQNWTYNKSISEAFLKQTIDITSHGKRCKCDLTQSASGVCYWQIAPKGSFYRNSSINFNDLVAHFERYAINSDLSHTYYKPLCSHPGITKEFIRKYLDKVDWNTLAKNEHVLEEIFIEHKLCLPLQLLKRIHYKKLRKAASSYFYGEISTLLYRKSNYVYTDSSNDPLFDKSSGYAEPETWTLEMFLERKQDIDQKSFSWRFNIFPNLVFNIVEYIVNYHPKYAIWEAVSRMDNLPLDFVLKYGKNLYFSSVAWSENTQEFFEVLLKKGKITLDKLAWNSHIVDKLSR